SGAQTPGQYAVVVASARAALTGDPAAVISPLEARMQELARAERFEDAACLRDRLTTLLRGLTRSQRIAPLAGAPEIIAARRSRLAGGSWSACATAVSPAAAAARAAPIPCRMSRPCKPAPRS
ncbi:UvrB/UvrC motif-containing protein, partial [Nostocoides sp.]|uniref:UvrB/UvrC motif-containing protein n=1 Tax=Nostocoides sp. TaxID=1917966 RepID=UPI003BAF56FF